MFFKTLAAVMIFLSWFCNSNDLFAQSSDIPTRTDDNVIIASYNIKWFGQLNHDYKKLAEVIQNFDVCGILEIKVETDLTELVDKLNNLTGKEWGYAFGMRTHRPHGTYYEAYGVVWRKDRVEIGNGLVSNLWDLEEAYRNDPYLVSFKSKNFDFLLFLVHTRWSADDYGNRENEVRMIVDKIDFIKHITDERDIIVAGDFNYSGTNAVMEEMASDAGLTQIDPNQKSTFKSNYSGYASSYDHIFISDSDTQEYISPQSAVLDVTRIIYGNNSVENMKKSKSELSDHLPIWAVFNTSMPDDD